MAYIPLTMEEIKRALGDLNGLDPRLAKGFDPGHDFERLPPPEPGDWLNAHSEPGQTFDDFSRQPRLVPGGGRCRIYLQPFGDFQKHHAPSIDILRELAQGFFHLEVEAMQPLRIDRGVLKAREHPASGHSQLLAPDILNLLKWLLPPDAFAILGLTMDDLYPAPSWNFVFGQASLRDRVGIFSFARYHPGFYGDQPIVEDDDLLLKRSVKVLVHETGHMFSLAHCIYFRCIMNGSNHLVESDQRPFFFCPICLRKLQSSLGFDVTERYRILEMIFGKLGFFEEQQWLRRRLKWISAKETASDATAG
jgi:archaemetzincin